MLLFCIFSGFLLFIYRQSIQLNKHPIPSPNKNYTYINTCIYIYPFIPSHVDGLYILISK